MGRGASLSNKLGRAIDKLCACLVGLSDEDRRCAMLVLNTKFPSAEAPAASPAPLTRSEIAKRAAHARWHASAMHNADASVGASSMHASDASHVASLSPDLNSSIISDPSSLLRPGSETETGAREEPKRRKKRSSPRVPMPDPFIVRDAEREKACELRLDIDQEVERLRTWTARDGRLFADWNAALRNHLDAQAERRDERLARMGGRQSEQEWQRTKAESSAYAGWDVFAGGKKVERAR